MSVPYRNRTYNRVLGGPRYIHLTKGTNAVFSGFSASLASAAISMNPITFVMNFYCFLFWHLCHFCSNRTPCYTLFVSYGFNHGWTLGGACYIHLTMRTNAVFSGFSASLVSATIFMNPITLVMNYLYFLFWHHRRHCWNRTPSLSLFLSNGSNHGWTLGGPRYIHLTKGTNAVFSGFFSLLATVDISMNSITLVMNYLYFIPDKDFPASRYFLWNVFLLLAHPTNLLH